MSGERTAASLPLLKADLSSEGLLLIDARHLRSRFSATGARRVKLAPLMTFMRELRSLIGAGLPLVQALSLLENRKDDTVLAGAIRAVRQGVEQGQSLDQAMASHPLVFDTLVQATVRAGTATGQLGPALDRLLRFMAIRNTLERKIRRAMAYPVFLLGVLGVVLALLMLFVLPRFAELYSEFGSDLPLPTRVLMACAKIAPIAIPVLFAGIVGVTVLLRLWLKNDTALLRVDRWRLRLPVVGPILSNTGLIQISFMMSMLLSAGMALRDALSFTASSLTNAELRARLARVADDVSQGGSLTDGLADQNLYPDLSRSLLAAGEAAGDLDRMFSEVAGLHEEILDDRLARILALIEPAMMMLVGIVLGTVIISIYLPIFGISSVVR